MQQITRLSDQILHLPTNLQVVRSLPNEIGINGKLITTGTPSFTKADTLECEIKDLISVKEEKDLFFKIITPNDQLVPASILFQKKHHEIADSILRLFIIEHMSLYESDKTAWLEMSISRPSITDTFYKQSFEFYKKNCMPNLSVYNSVYIRADKDTSSNLPFIKVETLHSLETQTYHSLKPNTYDVVALALLTDTAGFTYKDYTKMNCRGRDSASIQWNSLYVLMSTHCLKKGGSLHIQFYGAHSYSLSQFISFVSSLFSDQLIIKDNTNSASTITNVFVCIFQGYKGITKEQKEILLQWYHGRTSTTYYSDLGVNVHPAIHTALQTHSKLHDTTIQTVYRIAKEYKHILDKTSTTSRKSMVEWISEQRVDHFLTQVSRILEKNESK